MGMILKQTCFYLYNKKSMLRIIQIHFHKNILVGAGWSKKCRTLGTASSTCNESYRMQRHNINICLRHVPTWRQNSRSRSTPSLLTEKSAWACVAVSLSMPLSNIKVRNILGTSFYPQCSY